MQTNPAAEQNIMYMMMVLVLELLTALIHNPWISELNLDIAVLEY